MNKRLAVYTALTGGYDTLRQPERPRDSLERKPSPTTFLSGSIRPNRLENLKD